MQVIKILNSETNTLLQEMHVLDVTVGVVICDALKWIETYRNIGIYAYIVLYDEVYSHKVDVPELIPF